MELPRLKVVMVKVKIPKFEAVVEVKLLGLEVEVVELLLKVEVEVELQGVLYGVVMEVKLS